MVAHHHQGFFIVTNSILCDVFLPESAGSSMWKHMFTFHFGIVCPFPAIGVRLYFFWPVWPLSSVWVREFWDSSTPSQLLRHVTMSVAIFGLIGHVVMSLCHICCYVLLPLALPISPLFCVVLHLLCGHCEKNGSCTFVAVGGMVFCPVICKNRFSQLPVKTAL